MPLPNEHVARVKDPSEFDSETFRSKDVEEGIRIIIGKLKGATDDADSMVTESYHFSVDKFTASQAKAWMKDHDISYIKFEPATGEDEEEQVEEVTEGESNMEEIEKKETKVIATGKEVAPYVAQHKQFAITDFKAGKMEDGRSFIEGYANTKGKADRYGDIPTIFPKLRNYVYELKDFVKNPVLLIDHENRVESIAGSFNPKYGGYIGEDAVGLRFKAIFSESDHPRVKQARTVYSEGHGRALSIGGIWHYEDGDNPKSLTKADIFEISLVGVGADADALTVKKSENCRNIEGQDDLSNHRADLSEDEKVGRVLSKANEGKIIKAQEMLTEVLGSLQKEEEKQCPTKKLKFKLTRRN